MTETSLRDAPIIPAMSLAARIASARQRKGLSQDALGKMLGVSRAAVAQWESGQSSPAAERLIDLTDKLRVRFEWLYWGHGPMEGTDDTGAPNGYVWVPSLLSVILGDDGKLKPAFGPTSLFPSSLIEGDLRGAPSNFATMTMTGDAMAPRIPMGSTVMIDLRQTAPTPPGAFALWDGSGINVQWVSRLPGSEPPVLRLSSENPRFPSSDLPIDRAHLIGRVVWIGHCF